MLYMSVVASQELTENKKVYDNECIDGQGHSPPANKPAHDGHESVVAIYSWIVWS